MEYGMFRFVWRMVVVNSAQVLSRMRRQSRGEEASVKTFTAEEINLWKEMADMTLAKCEQHCHQLGSCCSPEYCAEAKGYALEHGVTLPEPGSAATPFLGHDGVCVVPPHLRPMCSLHQCKINSLGADLEDMKWTKEYFALRRKLERLMAKRMR
jgi:hypothetical protein